MIQANELRIGNLILHNDKIIKVLGIAPHCGNFAITYDGGWCYLKNCLPVILTEEMLLKCGLDKFRESINWSDWKLGDYRFHFRPKTDCANCFGIQIAGSNGHNISYFNWNLKHLHQLQNICHSLGQELDITL